MKTASARQMKAELESYLEASVDSPVVITKNGKPSVAKSRSSDKVS
ncbi:MAG: type II toxin-antitoxin system Phd/YefM family antitoxin [Planctomycetaceae bacterium]